MRPNFQNNFFLKEKSTISIGGQTTYYAEIKEYNELHNLIEYIKTKHLSFLVIGGCSNLLFPDQDFQSLIIKLKTNQIPQFQNQTFTISSEFSLSRLVFLLKDRHHDWSFFAGIPGTIGGAIYGNAGAYGHYISENLLSVTVYNTHAQNIEILDKAKLNFQYRQSRFSQDRHLIILDATFQYPQSLTTINIEAQIKHYLEDRKTKHPQTKSLGSFFKNPHPQNTAGKLIEQSNLKGLTIGEAQISTQHANFLINLGHATQQDIIKLAQTAQATVFQKFGIKLEPEAQIIDQYGQKIAI